MANHSHARLDELFTRFVDSDQHWGPLLFLRPSANQPLRFARVLALAALAGIAFGLLGSILLSLAARFAGRPALAVHIFPLALTALYFVLCQLTFVPAWNRRALRLSNRDRA
jgi:hypothetical protein